MTRQIPDGSTPSAYTSWPTVNEAHAILGVTVEELRIALANRGITANPEDRFPLEILTETVEQAGLQPQHLRRLRAPGEHFQGDGRNPNRRWS